MSVFKFFWNCILYWAFGRMAADIIYWFMHKHTMRTKSRWFDRQSELADLVRDRLIATRDWMAIREMACECHPKIEHLCIPCYTKQIMFQNRRAGAN